MKATAHKTRRKRTPKKKSVHRWSAQVMRTSDALDLQSRIFKSHDPARIARSLKRSSLLSKRRKGTPLQSAMSMLNFYINRAGRNLPTAQKRVLNNAKSALRKAFGRKETKR